MTRPIVSCFLALLVPAAASAAVLPAGFQERVILSGLVEPTSIAFGRNGDIWVSGRRGTVWLLRGGRLFTALTVPVSHEGERGAGNVAVDPDFATNGFIWLYYTTAPPNPHNRLSRFRNVGTILVEERPMLEGPTLVNTIHNGGCIRFAPDGSLFLTMGDDMQGSITAQNRNELRGKVLHMDRDGQPAADNPFRDGNGGDPRVWAWGFRNPWRCSIQPGSGNVFVGDVGGDKWEEIDIAVKGGNYGWAEVEGPEPAGMSQYTYPIYAYPHDPPPAKGNAIILGEHVGPGQFAPGYAGNLFYGDSSNGRLFRVVLDEANKVRSVTQWANGLGNPVDVRIGPDGNLYYASHSGGEVRQISFVGGGSRQPEPVALVDPTDGPAPLRVRFDATQSTDPDGDPLAFTWSFGDGTPTAAAPLLEHVYARGTYSASLRADDGRGGVATTPPIRIVSGNSRPRVSMLVAPKPIGRDPNVVGRAFDFSGEATDPEEGTLDCSHFTWTVILHHLEHTHPFVGPLQGTCNGSFVTTNHGEDPKVIHFEVRLEVEDTGVPLGPTGKLVGTASVSVDNPDVETASRRSVRP
jgi:glucose/arabinose dehydrogenase